LIACHSEPMKGNAARSKGKPRGIRRDRDCRTCKSRNVKCDLNRPGCNACRTARVQCGGYAWRVIWTNDGLGENRTRKRTQPGSKTLQTKTGTQAPHGSLDLTHLTLPPEAIKHGGLNWTSNQYRFLRWINAHYDSAKSAHDDENQPHTPEH